MFSVEVLKKKNQLVCEASFFITALALDLSS